MVYYGQSRMVSNYFKTWHDDISAAAHSVMVNRVITVTTEHAETLTVARLLYIVYCTA